MVEKPHTKPRMTRSLLEWNCFFVVCATEAAIFGTHTLWRRHHVAGSTHMLEKQIFFHSSLLWFIIISTNVLNSNVHLFVRCWIVLRYWATRPPPPSLPPRHIPLWPFTTADIAFSTHWEISHPLSVSRVPLCSQWAGRREWTMCVVLWKAFKRVLSPRVHNRLHYCCCRRPRRHGSYVFRAAALRLIFRP